MDIFFVIESLYIPSKLQEEFDQIDSCYAAVDEYLLVGASGVAGEEAILDCRKQHIIYLTAEGKAD